MALWGGPMVDTEGKFFGNLGKQIAGKCIFSWIFLGILEFHGEFCGKVDNKDTLHTTFLDECLYRYLNQRVRRLCE